MATQTYATHRHNPKMSGIGFVFLLLSIVAFGLLGDGSVTSVDPQAAVEIADVNFTGVVSSTNAIANEMRQQGHGSIVMLSSVAGEPVFVRFM